MGGQVRRADGKRLLTGKVGDKVTAAEAAAAARIAALNAVAAVASVTGGLSAVTQVVKITGFVASDPGFTGQPQVVNGASELLLEVFGEAGRHARSAVGTAGLPFDSPLGIELIPEARCRTPRPPPPPPPAPPPFPPPAPRGAPPG